MATDTSAHDRVRLGRRIASRLAASSHADAAFLAGSTVVGLGSATSDIDIYLVGSRTGEKRQQLFADDIRVDVQHLALESLEALVDRVLTTRLCSDRPGRPLSAQETSLVIRLWTGSIVTDAGALTALRQQLADEPLRLARVAMNNWILAAYFAAEDCVGLRQSDDPMDLDPAAHTARRALVCAGKALAAAGGDLYHGEKWVWQQLARSGPDGFPFAEFRRLLRDDPLASASGGRTGLSALTSFTQTCLIAAATLGWHGVDLGRWPAWSSGDGPLHRAPSLFPRVYDDVVMLIQPGGRHVRLTPEAALLWGLSHGRSEQTVTECALRLSGEAPVFAELTEERCRSVIAELRQSGLLTDSGRQGGAA
ncbi:hypothetical protein ACFZAT_31650 [Streptomyces sp. NPDC008163]|uniref:hypothetical protein n=1 Tax=Streptomyces sp. NPDC008163 TaxID=3364818 RepID=UPI0036EEA460